MGKPIDMPSPATSSSDMLADSTGVFGGDVIKLRAMGSCERAEFPAVARNAARMRLQVMSDHKPEHIEFFLGVVKEALEEAHCQFAESFPRQAGEQGDG